MIHVRKKLIEAFNYFNWTNWNICWKCNSVDCIDCKEMVTLWCIKLDLTGKGILRLCWGQILRGGGASDKGSVLYSYFIPLKGKEFFVYSTITSLKTFQSCIGYEKGCFLFLAMRKKKIKECAVLLEQIIHPSLSR